MDARPARRTHVSLSYNSRDITEDVSPNLISFTWNDKASKESDDISIKLEDTDRLWCGAWLPAKGASLSAAIIRSYWGGGSDVLNCGTFEIDEITVSGPPSEVTIKAVSVPISSSGRGEAKTRGWDNVTLSEIAGDIAGKSGLSLMYQLNIDPHYQREDQLEECDLSFLQGLAEEAGGALKVHNGKLIIFDEKQREAEPAVLEMSPPDMTRWSINYKSARVYKSCSVTYHDEETNEDYEHEEEAELQNLGGGDANVRVLRLNERCKNIGDAERIAKSLLHDANKLEVSGRIEAPGNPAAVAGCNIQLNGLGKFSGKYAVDTASHTVDGKGGYKMTLGIRRCPAGGGRSSSKGGGKFADWDAIERAVNEKAEKAEVKI